MSSPYYFGDPQTAITAVTLSNTNLDGSGANLVTVFTGGASGAMLAGVIVQAVTTVTTGFIRLFRTDGARTDLVKEIPVTPTVISVSTAAFRTAWAPEFPTVIPTGTTLQAGNHNAESIRIVASYGNK